jgi:hypothetical protein
MAPQAESNTKQYLKGRLFDFRNRFFVLGEDNFEIEVSPSKEAIQQIQELPNRNNPVVFEGRYETYRGAPLLKLRYASLVDIDDYTPEFDISVKVFAVYKNCIRDYNQEYNYLLSNVKTDSGFYKLKLNFTELPTTELVTNLVTFRVHRKADKLIATDILEIRELA